MIQLGYEQIGTGGERVLVLNDWICDTTTWDAARPYLDLSRFTWVFADLRGYGRSKHLTGRYKLDEASADALAVADALNWEKFSIVGHSMSSLAAMTLAQTEPKRIRRAVAVTPPPPSSFGIDDEMLAAFQKIGAGDDAFRTVALKSSWGERLSDGWVDYKVARWRAAATPEAAAAYVAMFAREGLADRTTKIGCPVLAITGEQDAPPLRADFVKSGWNPLCGDLTVVPFQESGHYPMQEMPPLFVAVVERFLGA